MPLTPEQQINACSSRQETIDERPGSVSSKMKNIGRTDPFPAYAEFLRTEQARIYEGKEMGAISP